MVAMECPLKVRIRDLNTKAYYLLVALSFLYYKGTVTPSISLKWALTLAAVVAVAPVQDWIESECLLEVIRFLKVACLWFALGFTLYWVWCASVAA